MDRFRSAVASEQGAAAGADVAVDGRLLRTHFAVWDQPALVLDPFRGPYIEQLAAGSMLRSMAQDRASLVALWQHGQDFSSAGLKPLGPIVTLREDVVGGFAEVDLLDVAYVNDLLPALRAGLLQASFRFRPEAERWSEPVRSDLDPKGMFPQCRVERLTLREISLCVMPVYGGTTAALAA